MWVSWGCVFLQAGGVFFFDLPCIRLQRFARGVAGGWLLALVGLVCCGKSWCWAGIVCPCLIYLGLAKVWGEDVARIRGNP